MPPLSELPAQQRAVLALILEKGKTYDEIAELLGLEVDAVRQRAHEALSGLAPAGGARPATRHRAAIGNYLLGQDPDAAPATYAYLERSVAGRDWAGALAAELHGLAAPGQLPEIPPDPDPDDDVEPEAMPEAAPPAPGPAPLPPEAGPEENGPLPGAAPIPAPAVSRRGGALVIALAVVLVAGAVAAFLLVRGGGTSHPPKAKPAATTTTPPAKLAGQIPLTAARGVSARGVAAVIVRGSQRVVAIAASGLQPTSTHLAYGVWLYNTRANSQLVGFVPTVKADGKISAAAGLPAGAAAFHELVITRENSNAATRPGQIIFSGAIPPGVAG